MGGESIWFRQEYLQPYLGLRLSYAFGLPRALAPEGQRAEIALQGDWAYVWGDNRDHHRCARATASPRSTPQARPGTGP